MFIIIIGKIGGTAVGTAIANSNHSILRPQWIDLTENNSKVICTFYCRTGHYPPSCFDIKHTDYYNKTLQPIFTIIRNPYNRLMSHFNYYHSRNPEKN